LQILGVAFNPNSANLVPDFIRTYGVNFPMGFASLESSQEYMQLTKPGYVPQMAFIDRKRMIRAQYTGADDFFKDQDKNIRALVETLLKEPAPAKKSASPTRKKPS
jgi:hypothetical protein